MNISKNKENNSRVILSLNDNWKLWRDKNAEWTNDKLYLPSEVNLTKISKEVKVPSGGWNAFFGAGDLINVNLPTTVEEYFTKDGTVEDSSCRGVSWFWREIEILPEWKDKRIFIDIQSARLRKEIFVNEVLVGYDIVCDTPYRCEITDAVKPGINRLAVRITNPGGNRGWEDFFPTKWGEYEFPDSHDFGGITGEVFLTVCEKVYLNNVVVNNLCTDDFKKIEVNTDLIGACKIDQKVSVKCRIVSQRDGKEIFCGSLIMSENDGKISATNTFFCPDVLLWSTETPNLYSARIELLDDSGNILDHTCVRFGFRVFNVKKSADGRGTYYYINGKRIFLKSAIDFGYYAYTGGYPSEILAEKNVRAAKELGHNSINLHRNIGNSTVIRKADELGLYLYEEPGGFRGGAQGEFTIDDGTFTAEIIMEKTRRMVLRDRNCPSIIIFNLCNEDDYFTPLREKALRMVHELSPGRMVVNTSGGNNGGAAPDIAHFRPYENEMRFDYSDEHTVGTNEWFDENDFGMHKPLNIGKPEYWGEVKCYPGPGNWYETYKMHDDLKAQKGEEWKGYNYSYYLDFGKQLEQFFDGHIFGNGTNSVIKSPGDISRASGYSKLYADGRNSQTIMSYDAANGFAINAWSTGNGMEGISGWYSGMVDDARNIKGDKEIYKFYSRPLQIAVRRTALSGKFFKAGRKAAFDISLINQEMLEQGEYQLRLSISDCAGKVFIPEVHTISVSVKGGDVFAQIIKENYEIMLYDEMHGGYITLLAELYNVRGEKITYGVEQIMLTNRPSFHADLKAFQGGVYQYAAAKQALQDAYINVYDYDDNLVIYDYIVASGVPDSETCNSMLKRVSDGAVLTVKFDSDWAEILFDKGILSAPVTEWNTVHEGYWMGNGFGYVEHFTGKTGLLENEYTSHISWEFQNDPHGFYPFETKFESYVFGLHVARPSDIRVLLCTVKYGKGKIVLNPSFDVENKNPMTDLLFYNIISMSLK